MKKSRRGPLPVVIVMNTILVLLIALVIIFVVAFVRELTSDDTSHTDSAEEISSQDSSQASSSEESVADTSSTDSSSNASSNPPVSYSEAVVPASDSVLNSYFDDAVFIGDSLTEGIKLYGVMSNATVLSHTGLGLDNIYTKEVVEQEDGTKISVMDALAKAENVSKIYILMGPNSIGYKKDTFISKYGAILDSIKLYHPNATIYLQSMLPVTTNNKYNLDNKVIDEYNLALIDLAEEKQIYFLDVNSSLKGSDGALPTEASPADGMHFNAAYYKKWFEYLKTHTVK